MSKRGPYNKKLSTLSQEDHSLYRNTQQKRNSDRRREEEGLPATKKHQRHILFPQQRNREKPQSAPERKERFKMKKVASKHGNTPEQVASSLTAVAKERELSDTEGKVLKLAVEESINTRVRNDVKDTFQATFQVACNTMLQLSPAGAISKKRSHSSRIHNSDDDDSDDEEVKKPKEKRNRKVMANERPPLPPNHNNGKKKGSSRRKVPPKPKPTLPFLQDKARMENMGNLLSSLMYTTQKHPLYGQGGAAELDYGNLATGVVSLLAHHSNVFLYKMDESVELVLGGKTFFGPAAEFVVALRLGSTVEPPKLLQGQAMYSEGDGEESIAGADQVIGNVHSFGALGLDWKGLSDLTKRGRTQLTAKEKAELHAFDAVTEHRIKLLSFEDVESNPREKLSLAKSWEQYTLLDCRPSKFPEDDVSILHIRLGGFCFEFDNDVTGQEAGGGEAVLEANGVVMEEGQIESSSTGRPLEVVDLDYDYDSIASFAQKVVDYLQAETGAVHDRTTVIRMVHSEFKRQKAVVDGFLELHRPQGDQLELVRPAKIYPVNSGDAIRDMIDVEAEEIEPEELAGYTFSGKQNLRCYGRPLPGASGCDASSIFDGVHMSFDGQPLDNANNDNANNEA